MEENRYVFVFYGRVNWEVICFEGDKVRKSFSSWDNKWGEANDYMDLFLRNAGNQYWYDVPENFSLEDYGIDECDLKDEPIEELAEYYREPKVTADLEETIQAEENRYAFVFYGPVDWEIICYEGNLIDTSFSSWDDDWAEANDYMDVFLGSTGNQYWYNVPRDFRLENYGIDEDDLKDEPIEALAKYLEGGNVEEEKSRGRC